jgi:hypothetical protein
MPEGVGYKIIGGLAWQIEFHAVNYTDAPVDATAAVNFWKADGPVTSEAGTLFMYHDLIAIPAGASATVRQRCPVAEDIQILGLVGHTHSRGVGFDASLDGAPLTSPLVLADLSSGDADTIEFDPAIAVTAGQVIDYQCDFVNNTDQLIVEGFSARRNEMCALAAYYYKPGGERMAFAEEVCWGSGVVYTGDGNCMQTQACDQAIDWGTWDQETGPAELYELCRVEACDASYGALDGCRWEMCPQCFVKDAEERPTMLLYDDPACTACVGAMCADELSACQAHTCP